MKYQSWSPARQAQWERSQAAGSMYLLAGEDADVRRRARHQAMGRFRPTRHMSRAWTIQFAKVPIHGVGKTRIRRDGRVLSDGKGRMWGEPEPA